MPVAAVLEDFENLDARQRHLKSSLA